MYEADGRHTGTRAVYTYVNDGRRSEAVHHLLGSFSYRETFSYPDGRRVEITSQFKVNERPVKEVYTYDADEGRLRLEPAQVTKRSISYY